MLPGYQCTRSKLGYTNSDKKFDKTLLNNHATEQKRFFANGDEQLDREESINHRDQFLLVLSAHEKRTLESVLDALQDAVENYRLIDLAYTLAVRRSTFFERCFIIASDSNVRQAMASEKRIYARAQRTSLQAIAFVFTGNEISHILTSKLTRDPKVKVLNGRVWELISCEAFQHILKRSDV